MNITIVPKNELSNRQLRHIAERIADEVHENDAGPIQVWDTYQQGLYAAVDVHGCVIALIEASGPVTAVNPGWWVDSRFRGRGAGKAVAKKLAVYLKCIGYCGIGDIRIETYRGAYDEASRRLKEIFIKMFNGS